MNAPLCGNCDRPTTDGTQLCPMCSASLSEALYSCPGLLEDLHVTLTKQDRLTAAVGHRSKPAETPLPVRFDITRVIDALGDEVTTWARDLVETHRLVVPEPTRRSAHNTTKPDIPDADARNLRAGEVGRGIGLVVFPISSPTLDAYCYAATWLAEHMGRLRRHPAAPEAYRRLTDALRRAREAVDHPDEQTRFPVGPCPENDPHGEHCTGQVWAHLPTRPTDPAELRCRVCATTWDTTRWHRAGARIDARRRQLHHHR